MRLPVCNGTEDGIVNHRSYQFLAQEHKDIVVNKASRLKEKPDYIFFKRFVRVYLFQVKRRTAYTGIKAHLIFIRETAHKRTSFLIGKAIQMNGQRNILMKRSLIAKHLSLKCSGVITADNQKQIFASKIFLDILLECHSKFSAGDAGIRKIIDYKDRSFITQFSTEVIKSIVPVFKVLTGTAKSHSKGIQITSIIDLFRREVNSRLIFYKFRYQKSLADMPSAGNYSKLKVTVCVCSIQLF